MMKLVMCLIAVSFFIRVKCETILILTTDPFFMGTFCPRPVNITCTGSESTFTFIWRNGSVDIARYGFFSDQTFPYPLTLGTPLQGVTAEVTNATSFDSVINFVSTLFVENVSVLNGYSIYCQDGSGVRSRELNINVGPNITSSVTVISTYTSRTESAELNEVLVQWKHVDQSMISEGCLFNDELNYTVVLEDNGTIIEQRVISSDSCVNGFCETSFVSTSSNSYVVHVTATNGIGLSSATVQSSTIERSIPFIFDVSFANCETSVLCSYNYMGNCTVQFTQNFDYQDLSEGTLGHLNSPFLLPLMEPTTTFYYQATVTINSSTTIQIRRSFTTGEFDVRLASVNLALLVLGVIVLCVTIACCFVLVLMKVKSDKGSWLSLVVLVVSLVVLVVSLVVLVVVSVMLWMAVGFQVGLQDNTCDSAWQGTRDSLIIAAFVFSMLSLFASAATILAFFIGKHKSNKSPRDTNGEAKKEELEIQMEENKSGLKRGKGGRVKALEAPEVMVNEFKAKGEKALDGKCRTGEKRFKEYDGKVDNYAALQHNTPPVKEAAPNPTYSTLDTPENTDSGEYSTLDHGQDKKKKKGSSKKKVAPANPSYSKLNTPENTERKDSMEYSTLNNKQDKKSDNKKSGSTK